MTLTNQAPVITAMIVDDEPLARQGLQLRLSALDDFEIVASCASAIDARHALLECAPMVVFLDIEMPGLSGIDFADWLHSHCQHKPKIIFVTAFQEFALKAFDFDAFDYLLKPTSDERFETCVLKLRRFYSQNLNLSEYNKLNQLLTKKTGRSVPAFIDSLSKSKSNSVEALEKTISLKSGTEWLRISTSSINWIEAAGDYMCVHTLEGTHIIRKTLKDFEQELNANIFIRVNRSAIINLKKVTKLSPNSNGEYHAMLSSGDCVKVSRKYKTQFSEFQPSAKDSSQ